MEVDDANAHPRTDPYKLFSLFLTRQPSLIRCKTCRHLHLACPFSGRCSNPGLHDWVSISLSESDNTCQDRTGPT